MSQAARTLTALVVGLLLGIGFVKFNADWALAATTVTDLVGSAWLHALQMVIVPLIVGLLVTGVGVATDAARAGRIALRAFLTFVAVLWTVTIASALLTPLLVKLWPLPQAWADAIRQSLSGQAVADQVPTLWDFLNSIVPSNVVTAAASNSFLPLTVFALVFAFAVTRLPEEQREKLTSWFAAVTDALLVIIGWVLKIAPIGVFALAYVVGARTGAAAFGALAHYIIIVSSIGLMILLAAYPFAALVGRVSIPRFARALIPAQAVAISTQSSLASLPPMLKASRELGASAAAADIVLPMAVAVFRATSPAMNLAVCLYVAHLLGHEIGPGALAAGVLTAAITTMGSVSLPGTISFIASTAPVAIAMGVPIEALGLLVAVETVPDLFRTVGNVTMDVAVTLGVSRRSGAESEDPAPSPEVSA